MSEARPEIPAEVREKSEIEAVEAENQRMLEIGEDLQRQRAAQTTDGAN